MSARKRRNRNPVLLVGCELVASMGHSAKFPQELKLESPCGPALPQPSTCPGSMESECEATAVLPGVTPLFPTAIRVSTDAHVGRESMVHTHNGMLSRHEKNIHVSLATNSTGGPVGH